MALMTRARWHPILALVPIVARVIIAATPR